jgi:hypothetical protein
MRINVRGVTFTYGSGDECPALGSEPSLTNCRFCHDSDSCIDAGVVPLCVACSRCGWCLLFPTSSCSLFQRDSNVHVGD